MPYIIEYPAGAVSYYECGTKLHPVTSIKRSSATEFTEAELNEFMLYHWGVKEIKKSVKYKVIKVSGLMIEPVERKICLT